MYLRIKDPSFVKMQNGKHLFDFGQVAVMALFGERDAMKRHDIPTYYHYPNMGSDPIEIGIRTKNPQAKSLEPIVTNLCFADLNPYTCIMRLSSPVESNELYTLIIQPFSDEFEIINGYYEVLPLTFMENFNIKLEKFDRWPNGLVFKLIKTTRTDIDYVVRMGCFLYSNFC